MLKARHCWLLSSLADLPCGLCAQRSFSSDADPVRTLESAASLQRFYRPAESAPGLAFTSTTLQSVRLRPALILSQRFPEDPAPVDPVVDHLITAHSSIDRAWNIRSRLLRYRFHRRLRYPLTSQLLLQHAKRRR